MPESRCSDSSTDQSASLSRALRLHRDDNVVVVMQDTLPGPVSVFGTGDTGPINASEAVSRGHKLAAQTIAAGTPIVKYGVCIGLATEPIAQGAWVHTHNCRSRIDERSHTLDRHTGAPTDTKYV